MKIMHVLPTLTVGGAETLVADYLIRLKTLGHDVAVLVYIQTETAIYEKLKNHGIKIYCVSKKYNNVYDLVEKILRKVMKDVRYWNIIKRFNPDILHFHLHMYPKKSEMKKYKNIKLFYTFHSDIERYIREYGEEWKRNISELSELGKLTTFALSYEMLEVAKKKISRKNVYYLPNGIDIVDARKHELDKSHFLKGINKENSNPIIVHVGRLLGVKNHKKTFDIFKNVLINKPDALLLIVGTGEAKYCKELEEYVTKIGIKNNTVFLGFRTDINEILSVCDYGVLPSFYEGFPLTVLEYQAHGLRSVVSKAVPEEAICNKNCFRLDVDCSNDTWCKYLLGEFENKIEKDLMVFDSDRIIKALLKYYNK